MFRAAQKPLSSQAQALVSMQSFLYQFVINCGLPINATLPHTIAGSAKRRNKQRGIDTDQNY